MLMLVSMALTLMQDHSGSGKRETYQRCMLSASKPAISIKLAATVGTFLRDLDLDFANILYGLSSLLIFLHCKASKMSYSYCSQPILTYNIYDFNLKFKTHFKFQKTDFD